MANSHVWFLNRADGKILETSALWAIRAVCSTAQHGGSRFRNYITGEVFAGERIHRLFR
jgi:hypothetical protein